MKIAITLVCTMIILSGIVLIPNAFAENVPDWVKNTAGWWAEDAISETEFVNAIEFLVKENIIHVNVSQTSETSQGVPDWVKNTAGWWAEDAISETEFVNAIAYLIKVGIISVESSKIPELIAEMWVNGDINDDEFLANVEQMIEKDIITIQSDSITSMSDLPDWLLNNAGWWAARILTNSDFEFNPGYVKEEIYPCTKFSPDTSCFTRTYNSHGFRSNEFQEQKHDVDFRIFAVGGSTTYGSEANDDETWPAHLQQIINEKITGKKIEVINSGLSGAMTESEYDLIKHKISSFDPDLIIMYDGWNDFQGIPVEKTIRSWESVCKLGENERFDVIIIVQPLADTYHRVLTEQEITSTVSLFPNSPYLQESEQYVAAFEVLDEVCTKTADFRRIFDYVQEPIFYDGGHTMSFGNKIIAENVFSVISPIFGKTYSVIHNNLDSAETSVVYAVGADLSGKNFDNLNLQNAVFDKANLDNTSFKNANIDGARFVFADLSNSNLLDRTDLSNTNLAGTDLSNINLKGKDLAGTILTGAILSHTNLSGVDLSGKYLTGTILTGADLSHTNLSGVDLSGKNLTGTILTDADLSHTNLSGVDLSGRDLTGTILTGSILSHTNLSGVDLSGKDLTGTTLRRADLSHTNLSGVDLSGRDLTGTILTGVDLSGKDLSNITLKDANLENTSLQNAMLLDANLDSANLTNADLRNTLLVDANLSNAILTGSNLEDAILTNTILDCIGHPLCV